MTNYNFDVTPSMIAFDQGNSNLCWLAASAVLFQWQSVQPLTLQDAANRLGVEFAALYASGSVLPFTQLPLWQARGPFQSQGQQCFDANGWFNLISTYGPLITLVSANATGYIDHAVVVGGIHGDGSPAGTDLSVADGNGGVVGPVSLSTFATMFEVTGGPDTLFSVMYF
jgi:Papain-like cysteine protease AvrRpt2